MKQNIILTSLSLISLTCLHIVVQGQNQDRTVKKGTKYDTIIVKHIDKAAVKPVAKPVPKPESLPVARKEIILPVPEYINQPYYYESDSNRLIRLENTNAQMITKKKSLGLKGSKQFLSMEAPSSKIRFIAKKDLVFYIKTSGDMIDLTSYIKLYQFIPADQKREVTINSREGLLNDKDASKGKLMSFSFKMISKDNYMIQLPEQLDAGEYGFVWVKNMELKEFNVFGFGVDWKSSN